MSSRYRRPFVRVLSRSPHTTAQQSSSGHPTPILGQKAVRTGRFNGHLLLRPIATSSFHGYSMAIVDGNLSMILCQTEPKITRRIHQQT